MTTAAQHQVKVIRAHLKVLSDEVDLMEAALVDAPRVLFCSPVTGKIEPQTKPFGGDWFSALGYAQSYSGGFHTGDDLNRPAYQDSGALVFAAADGVVKFSGAVHDWQGDVVIIEHALEDGSKVWTRYAHIKSVVPYNAHTRRGDQIGTIADYNRDGPKADHLHFDVAFIDLGVAPGDWPGQNKQRLVYDYTNPAAWLMDRAK